MSNEKLLLASTLGKIKNVLKETNVKVNKVMEDTTLETPILSDIVLSYKASAYDEILKIYKEFQIKKKNENQ